MRMLAAGFALLVGLVAGPLVLAQQMAITFDDLPAHGALPSGMTRLSIAESVLKTLKTENAAGVRLHQWGEG
jgi:hypothetical protein